MQHTQKNNRLQNHNNRQPQPVTTVIGKVPPQSMVLEEAVLGLCLLDTKAFDVVSEILCPEAFYSDAHQRIFKAFAALNRVCQPIDMLTVCNQLIKTKELEMIGGPYSVTKLTNAVVSGANVQDHARIILQKFIQRELIRIGNEITVDAYDEGADVFDLLDETEAKVYAITNNYVKHDYANAINILSDVVSRVDFLRANPQSFTGVTSGFACIDNITHGWQPTDLIILAARPGVGKTAFALNLARNACLNSAKPLAVGFFSLEMSAPQLMQRVVSAESGVPLENIMRGKLTEAEYDKFMKDGVLPLEKTHMYIDDTPALNIFELRSRARRMVNKHGVGLLIIDYLQLMRGHGDRATREQEHFDAMVQGLWRVLKTGGFLFARLASDIGIEQLVNPLGDGRYLLPDGSQRFLVNEQMLLDYTANLGGELYEPIKTTNVQNLRCMTTWCLKKL